MNKSIKLHIACGKEKPNKRRIFQFIKVTKQKCVASDGIILAVVPTSVVFSEEFISQIPESGFLLHAKDYKKLLKYDSAILKLCGCIIHMTGVKKRVSVIQVFKESEIGAFPKWESSVPSLNNLKRELKKSTCIDAKLLHRLQKSLGILNSHLIFFEGRSPIEVEPATVGENNALGILSTIHRQN